MSAMKNASRHGALALAAVFALSAGACKKDEKPAEEAPAAEPKPADTAAATTEEPEAEEAAAEEAVAVPTPEDFEEEAAETITEDTLEKELTDIEKRLEEGH